MACLLSRFDQFKHCIRAFHLSKISAMCSQRTSIKVLMRTDQIGGFRRSKEASIDRKECIPICPPKGHQTISFGIAHGGMVKHSGTQLCFLTAGTLEKAVIDNERIHPVLISQRLNRISHYFGKPANKKSSSK